mmetsp:Transcript_51523/g.85374  ORF Transcript_51523/g.85374 Transcript_51523/m.85374 type:complete len:146 (+) Transcript_51523:40-477(+)
MAKKSKKNKRKFKRKVKNDDAAPSCMVMEEKQQVASNDSTISTSASTSSSSLVSPTASATDSTVDDITEKEVTLNLMETSTESILPASKPYISLNMNLSDDIESLIAKLNAKQSRIREIRCGLQQKLQLLHGLKTSRTQQTAVNC